MERRDFLKMLTAGSVTSGLFPSYTLSRMGEDGHGTSDDRYNVLFIGADDLNDWIGCMGGYPGVKTPNIDRLASRGMLFQNAHCAAPRCGPSRTALLTGIQPSTSGVYANERRSEYLPDATTLPAHFRKNGYATFGGGKIFHGNTPGKNKRFNDEDAWDEYFYDHPMKTAPMPPDDKIPLNGLNLDGMFDWGGVDVPTETMGDARMVTWANSVLARDHDQPFFLGVGFFRPHLPWYVPREYFDRYPIDEITLPEVKEDDLEDVNIIAKEWASLSSDHARITDVPGKWKAAVQGYLACVSFVDDQVGRLLDALDESRYSDNTVVVLWGDHGWHLGEKLHWRKFALWEEATHNPLIITAPGIAEPGTRTNQPASLMDIYPTLIDLCGLENTAHDQDGMSLAPLLREPGKKRQRPALTTFGFMNHSLRNDRWRYIRYVDGSEELYDHQNDPLEWNNLAGQPEYKGQKEKMARWLPDINVPGSSFTKMSGDSRDRVMEWFREQKRIW